MTTVTVIIPTYNRGYIISETIDSVLNQKYQDFEIIIVDDGSTDNTRTIIEEYIRKNPDKIRYYYQKKKGGPAARNIGIKKARGKYIANLDSDDISLPDRLEKEIVVLNKHPEIGLVYSDVLLRENDITKEWIRIENEIVPADEIIKRLLLEGCFIVNSSIMYRKEIAETVPFNENFMVGDDYLFFLEMAKRCSFYGIKECLLIIVKRSDSLIKKKDAMFEQRIKSVKEFYKNGGAKNISLKSALSMSYMTIAKDILYSNEIEKKTGKYIKSVTSALRNNIFNIYIYKHLLGDLLLRGKLIRLWR
ncbi:glycosyltransferase family 2 protein [Elusimicrobiota bacterium]